MRPLDVITRYPSWSTTKGVFFNKKTPEDVTGTDGSPELGEGVFAPFSAH